ncbi:recombination protein NinG [Pseudomonas protegens]|uniref:recombination protein NinG n=1 Tax=Pseudomonas protegens TaxID=380021 RepID=UPI001B320155|nr:recombination protein NinG [Pseudomonas protegens]MBP5121006.1 recombination protein NinG [Pseudomonas protegens]
MRVAIKEKKAPKSKTCKNPACRASFVPQRLGQAVCGYPCGLAIKEVNQAKARKALAEVGRKELRAAKERVKPRSQYMREAQAAFNAWVRLRDAAHGCVSCDKPATWAGQWHASHFRSVGSSPEHRFNPINVHKACSVCNNHLSGNILGYRPELERRIGVEAVEALLGPSEQRRYTVEDLKAITAEYRSKTRELKRGHAA